MVAAIVSAIIGLLGKAGDLNKLGDWCLTHAISLIICVLACTGFPSGVVAQQGYLEHFLVYDDAEGWLDHGVAYSKLGRHDGVGASCDSALKYDPNLTEAEGLRNFILILPRDLKHQMLSYKR